MSRHTLSEYEKPSMDQLKQRTSYITGVNVRPQPGGKYYLVCVDQRDVSIRALEQCVSLVTSKDVVEIFQVMKMNQKDERAQDLRQETLITLRQLVENELTVQGKEVLNFHADAVYNEDIRKTIMGKIDLVKPDMLVIGSRGLNLVEGMLLGSVSRFLINEVKIPILLVK
ncbi:hypothetical protein EDD86DRAFT_215192 [Gorgonomyces haynaldii]|nr:hypothetical protein EDD86DRAFT_215192 [Gorgonomyces haynaldii]